VRKRLPPSRRPKFYQYGEVIELITVASRRVEELLTPNEVDEFNLLKGQLGKRIADDENVEFREDLPSIANLTVLTKESRKMARGLKRWLVKNDIPLAA
jgi:hypothetical protein